MQAVHTPHATHLPRPQVWVAVPAQPSPSRGNNNTSQQQTTRWVPATVTRVDVDAAYGGMVLSLNTPDGTLTNMPAHACPLRNERDDTIDDLVKSDFLHEPGILHTLQARYALDDIYTFSGPNILIAVCASTHTQTVHTVQTLQTLQTFNMKPSPPPPTPGQPTQAPPLPLWPRHDACLPQHPPGGTRTPRLRHCRTGIHLHACLPGGWV